MVVHRTAIPAPTVTATAEEPISAAISKPVRKLGAFTSVEIAGRPVGPKSPALQHASADALFLELECEGDSRRAAANDTYFGLDDRAVIKAPCIHEHRFVILLEKSAAILSSTMPS